REKRMVYMPPEELDGFSAADAEQPAEDIFSRQDCERLRGCISSLNDSYQAILALKYSQEMSNREIAGLLDITPKNAEMRLYRAKQKLRGALVKEGIAVER
ncbi:MAG: RNA polymerase sigma factor, partial [Acetanaerobacterium sp.]